MADPVVHITSGVPDSGTGNITTLGQVVLSGVPVLDGAAGTIKATVKGASTGSAAVTDPALVVTIRDVNANLTASPTAVTGTPIIAVDQYAQYETVAASQNDQILGATGAQYDYLAGLLIVPGTAAAGAVSIKDGNGSAISVFAGGGTTALPSLVPFMVPLGLYCTAATTPGWKVTTGTNVTAVGIGKFT